MKTENRYIIEKVVYINRRMTNREFVSIGHDAYEIIEKGIEIFTNLESFGYAATLNFNGRVLMSTNNFRHKSVQNFVKIRKISGSDIDDNYFVTKVTMRDGKKVSSEIIFEGELDLVVYFIDVQQEILESLKLQVSRVECGDYRGGMTVFKSDNDKIYYLIQTAEQTYNV